MQMEAEIYLRRRVDEIADRLAETHQLLKSLAGNGQPGRMGIAEIRIAKLEKLVNRIWGVGAISSLLVIAAEFAVRLFR